MGCELPGAHVTLDAVIEKRKWPRDEDLSELLSTAASVGRATPIKCHVISLPCELSRPDSPPGGTAWCGLDESHITLHWYDKGDAVEFALDVFTCGDHANPEKIVNFLETKLGADTPIRSEKGYYSRMEFLTRD